MSGVASVQTPTEASRSALMPGDVMDGRYRLERWLAEGPNGVVFLAREVSSGRDVALKFLPAALASDASVVQRFEAEAKFASKLDHPNVLPLLAVGRHAGQPYAAMPHVEGCSLAEHLRARGGKLGREEFLALARQFCAGLGFLHARGIVHRGVNPHSLFVGNGGNAFVLDLPFARVAKPWAPNRADAPPLELFYLSPEQALGRGEVDHRSDLYSLGVVFYEMLAGARPFEATTGAALMDLHAHAVPPNVSAGAPWVPRAAAAVLQRALAKSPTTRFQSGPEMLLGLEAAFATSKAAPEPFPESPAAPAPPLASSPSATPPKARAQKKVVVVDDSEVALEAAQIALEEAGYYVVTLDNPLMLVNVVRREDPDLLLVDVSMPTLAGDQLVEIARRHGATSRSRIVLHSDLPAERLRELASRCGAQGFIRKTSDEAAFLSEVKRWLEA